MLHAVFVRSPLAHARIRRVDLSRAAEAPGVALALSGPDLAQLVPPVAEGQIRVPSKWTTVVQHKFLNPQQPLLAHDKVRHVGEAVAIIVAETRYQAEDAAELVGLDLEELPAVVDPEAALQAGAPVVHERYRHQSDRLVRRRQGGSRGGAGARAASIEAPLLSPSLCGRADGVPRCRRRLRPAHRLGDRSGRRRRSCIGYAAKWPRRSAFPRHGCAVIALDVGGGFGGKGHAYPEDLLVPFLARRLGRPVRWIEERREHFLSRHPFPRPGPRYRNGV